MAKPEQKERGKEKEIRSVGDADPSNLYSNLDRLALKAEKEEITSQPKIPAKIVEPLIDDAEEDEFSFIGDQLGHQLRIIIAMMVSLTFNSMV